MINMYQPNYEDILAPRRKDYITWAWSSRRVNPKEAVCEYLKSKTTPEHHKAAVLESRKVKELIIEISKQRNVKREVVEKEAAAILEEIGYRKSLKVIRYLSYTLAKIFLKVSSHIYVNHASLLKLKSEMGNRPVVFVPSHRSYADFIIFSYLCFHYDIEIPAIAAGMDFHGMLGMGEMLRNTGAFFMRRSYNNDSMYWTIFKEYINQLVCKGALPIEFFIEGTRSRSNKSIVPKYGLINMILKAYFLSQVPDVLFVPVSITYDRILEDNLFAFELLGIPKPPESTSGFFKSMTILNERFGNIYFHFAEPISTREFMDGKLDRLNYTQDPIQLLEIREQDKTIIPSLAFEIIRRQQLSSVVSHINLLALILNKNITRGRVTTSVEELARQMTILASVLRNWGATIFNVEMEEAIGECLKVHHNLICLKEGGTVGLVSNRIRVGKISEHKWKAYPLSEDTISYSVPFMQLQIYTNPVLHYLVDGAILIIVLRSMGNMHEDDLFKHYSTLRAIFSYEFVLLESWYKMHFEDALKKLQEHKIATFREGQIELLEDSDFEEVLFCSMQPFVLTYFVTTEILQKVSDKVDEKTIMANVQKLFEEAISEKKIFIHPYCMSLDSIANALASFAQMGIVKKSRVEGKNIYEIQNGLLSKLKSDLEIYIPSFHVIKSFDIFLHIKSKL